MGQFSNRRSKRADARRVEILRAAARIFRSRGFAAAGMREIATAADLSHGNLYHYFEGKNEILFFCQDRSLDRLLAALAAARRDSRPLADRLRNLAASHVRCLLDDVEGSAAHLAVDALPPRLRAQIIGKRDRYERGVRRLVAEGIRSGALRMPDATIATRGFLGALNWSAHWYRPEGAQTPNDIADLLAAYAVAGLSPATTRQLRATHAQRSDRADRQRRTGGGRLRAVQDAARGPA